MVTSSRDAASTPSGTKAMKSYQDRVYIELTSHATDSTRAVRTATVISSWCGSTPSAMPGTDRQGSSRHSRIASTPIIEYDTTPVTIRVVGQSPTSHTTNNENGCAQDPPEM